VNLGANFSALPSVTVSSYLELSRCGDSQVRRPRNQCLSIPGPVSLQGSTGPSVLLYRPEPGLLESDPDPGAQWLLLGLQRVQPGLAATCAGIRRRSRAGPGAHPHISQLQAWLPAWQWQREQTCSNSKLSPAGDRDPGCRSVGEHFQVQGGHSACPVRGTHPDSSLSFLFVSFCKALLRNDSQTVQFCGFSLI
jgi:hypothetical protein